MKKTESNKREKTAENVSVIYHVSTHAKRVEIVTNPKCTLLFAELIFALIIHSTYLCRWVSLSFASFSSKLLCVYVILCAVTFFPFYLLVFVISSVVVGCCFGFCLTGKSI